MSQNGKRLTNDEWHKLTKDSFNDFRVSHHPSTGSLLHPSTQATTQVKQSAMDFKRGIKHDVSQYPTLKDERYFDQFRMAMVAQARAHDIEEVFDPDYKPSTEDKALFLEKQKFAFAVLMKCVQTDTGKTFVCLHQDSSDAQLVWKKLLEHATKSTSAELDIVELQHLLANSKDWLWMALDSTRVPPLLEWQCQKAWRTSPS